MNNYTLIFFDLFKQTHVIIIILFVSIKKYFKCISYVHIIVNYLCKYVIDIDPLIQYAFVYLVIDDI